MKRTVEDRPVERVKFRSGTLFGGQNQSKDELLQEHAAKAALIALRQQEKAERDARYIPDIPGTKPTPIQQEIIDSFARYQYTTYYVRGGNQSKPGYSLILMADYSLRPISHVRVGDMVKCLDFQSSTYVDTMVTAVHNHGQREVSRFHFNDEHYIDMTSDHEMVQAKFNNSVYRKFYKEKAAQCKHFLGFSEFRDYDLSAPARSEHSAKFTELLGYLIGDGCLTKDDRGCVQFTNTSDEIIKHVSSLLEHNYILKSYGTTDYYIVKSTTTGVGKINIYKNMLAEVGLWGKYAHEKTLPAYIFSESDAVKLRFISGLIATDGWCEEKGIGFCTTSFALADGLLRLFHTLGIHASIGRGKPPAKSTHRQTYQVRIRSARAVAHLAKYLKVPSKPIVTRTNTRGEQLTAPRSVERVAQIGTMEVYDITVANASHNYICDGYVTGNSGKSQLCAYLIAHLMQENLAGWKRKERWHKEPLLLLWLSRQSAQIEESLWRKCRPYFTPGTFKEVRAGGALKKIIMNNGNTLLFFSYQNINEATDAVQSFTGHYVFLDELPSKAKLIEESMNRLIKNEGLFMAAFTPKKPSPEVKRIVMGGNPAYTVGYRLMMSDNPGITDEAKAQQREKAASYGSKMEAAILTGDWVDSDNLVFYIDEDKITRPMPPNYSQEWRHFESSDPAVASGFGFVVMAEDPADGRWYVVRAKVLSGPEIECDSVSVQTVKKLTADFNMFRRIADPAACNYIRTAHKAGLRYTPGPNKHGAFEEHVAKVQEALGRQVFITPEAEDLLDQLSAYERSEDNPDHVIHRKKFHLIDAFRYAIAMLPPYKAPPPPADLTPIDPQKWIEDRVYEVRDKRGKKESFEDSNNRKRNAYWGATIGSQPVR
jgi:hypothetical protein